MPCDSWGYPSLDAQRKEDELNKAIAAACDLARTLDAKCPGQAWRSAVSPATLRWVKEHFEIDLKKQALAKLTVEERVALGFFNKG